MDITRIREFIAINEQVHKVIDRVIASEEIPEYDKWRFIYDYVFSEHCSRKVYEIHSFDWCDPDMDYRDDVMAFVNAFDGEVIKLKTLL